MKYENEKDIFLRPCLGRYRNMFQEITKLIRGVYQID